MSGTITWRVYRDPAKAPVPVVRKASERRSVRFIPEGHFVGDVAVVEEYTSALGLYTLTTWKNGNTLPTQAMRDEPILLNLKSPYGGRLKKMAVVNKFAGSGYNAYLEPRIVTIDETPHVLIPPHPTLVNKPGQQPLGGAVIDSGDDVTVRTFVAQYIGNKAYRFPAGFSDLHYVTVDGNPIVENFYYDPYHGTLVVEDALEGSQILVTVKTRYRMTRPVPVEPGMVQPVLVDGHLYGYLTASYRSRWEDARRLPAPMPGARVDSMYYDGEPISGGHLWIVVSDAEADRMRDAVRRTLPAGSLYRQVDTYVTHRPELLLPASGSTLDGSVTFVWEALDEAVQYQLQISRDAAFEELEVNNGNLSEATFTTNRLTPDRTYYWRVRAYDGLSMGSWSPRWTFTATGTTAPDTLTYTVPEGTFVTSDGYIFGVRP